MNEISRLELILRGYDAELDSLLEQLIACRKHQARIRGELNRARRLEREAINAKRVPDLKGY